MADRDRALRPLEEAKPSIDALATYESPAALQDALRATWHAVEQALRQVLRSDVAAADEVRLRAMSRTEFPLDAVITELRRRDVLSLGLAGQVHELSQAVQRAQDGAVRAADADLATSVVEGLYRELRDTPRDAPPRERPVAEAAAADAAHTVPPAGIGARLQRRDVPKSAGAPGDPVEDDVAHDRSGTPAMLRRPLVLVAAAAVIVVVVVAAVLLFGRSNDLDQGVTAFRAGRAGVAEQHFRAALQRDEGSITARLYLARILREQRRHQESADLLREAARRAPRDAAVRRELGYLFLDLERPQQAAAQFQQSVELEPEEALGWVWLVQSLRLAGDQAGAESWMARAPATAQAMLRTGRPPERP